MSSTDTRQTAAHVSEFMKAVGRFGQVTSTNRADTLTFTNADDLRSEVRVQGTLEGVWIRVFTRNLVLCYEIAFQPTTPSAVLEASLAAVLQAEKGGRL